MTARFKPIVIALVLSCMAGASVLRGDENQDNEESVENLDSIHKGRTELALLGGVGIAHEIWDGVGDTRLYVVGLRMGRVVSGPRGPGFLTGNLEVSGELLPLFLIDQGHTTYGFSLTLLARHFLCPGSRWRPYVTLGLGALSTQSRVPVGTARINFTPQMGLGLACSYNQRFVLYVDYRIHHISNADTADTNPGINSSYLQFSASVLRW